jgi:hypothetical protein
MTDAKPAGGTYYFAEFGLRSKGAPLILYRSGSSARCTTTQTHPIGFEGAKDG